MIESNQQISDLIKPIKYLSCEAQDYFSKMQRYLWQNLIYFFLSSFY